MTDKLAAIVPKLTKLLLVTFDNGSTDGERINALGALREIREIREHLKGADSDSHDLVKRLLEPLSQEQMQQIFNAGMEKGRAEEIENARRNAVTITTPFVAGDVGRGVGAYSWLQIARHCASNTHRLNDWERRFVASVSRQLIYKAPTPDQASKLHQIFHERFGEKI